MPIGVLTCSTVFYGELLYVLFVHYIKTVNTIRNLELCFAEDIIPFYTRKTCFLVLTKSYNLTMKKRPLQLIKELIRYKLCYFFVSVKRGCIIISIITSVCSVLFIKWMKVTLKQEFCASVATPSSSPTYTKKVDIFILYDKGHVFSYFGNLSIVFKQLERKGVSRFRKILTIHGECQYHS